MKTITSCALVVVAAACAACATHEPATSGTASRTLPALPQPQTYTARQLAALRKTPGGEYPGYQRIVLENGQARYCRWATPDSRTDSRVVCLREAQIWAEQLAALEQLSFQDQQSRRAGTAQLESQENWAALAQSNAVNMPVTPPMRQH